MSKLQETNIQHIIQTIQSNSPNEALAAIENCIREATTPATPHPRRAKPWFNQTCYRKRKETIAALHEAKVHESEAKLKNYAAKRREYKELIRRTREEFRHEEEKKMIEDAEKDPFKALRPKQPHFPRNIPIELWTQHLTKVLQHKETRPTHDSSPPPEWEPITKEDIQEALQQMKERKAAGPDCIFNEHLKQAAPILVEVWATFMTECLKRGCIPDNWRKSKVKMLYKGKGDVGDPNNYRGIALQSNLYKTFTKIMNSRLTALVETKIPELQFGFRKGRSTTQAAKCLHDDIVDALRHPKGKLYALFIDYTKAFDLINRQALVSKMDAMIGREHYIAQIIRNILQNNQIEIDDGIMLSEPIEQTNGVLQGDPLSPLLFNIATADIISTLPAENVNMYVYADDMVATSTCKIELQETLDKLVLWARANDMHLNPRKTVTMTFRKGGRPAADDILYLEGEPLTRVNHFKYLGITFQTTGTTYTLHVKDKTIAAIRATNDISHLGQLSVESALKLFHAKISPIVTYGLALIWEHLNKSNLKAIEAVKAKYLKKVLCVSKYTPSRLTYELAREPFYLEELRLQLQLPSTQAYDETMTDLQEKRLEIWSDFYTTDAMTTREWMAAGYELRHTMTRFAVHGFHHRLCRTKTFHLPAEDCVCELCLKSCDRYHARWCTQRSVSMTRFCE